MESLTRNNYEIWFLDYLDGQLGNEQLEVLLDFLEQNPDLKEELRGISGVILPAGTESIERKELLLKGPFDIPGISAVDQLCIARMENDLTDEEASRFDARLSEDTTLDEKFAAFRMTRLDPSTRVIYPYKSELRKKTVILSPWLITAISSAAIILLAWFLWPDSSHEISNGLANLEIPASGDRQPISTGLPPTTQNSQLVTDHRQPVTRHSQRASAGIVRQIPVPEESPVRQVVPLNALSPRSAAGPRIPDPRQPRILYASNYPSATINSVPADDALTVPQYALQVFREKILGGDRKQVRKTRFSMWEVAGAGVDKINSLAGTQMKLNREYDSQGDLLAVSFNSRLLDVESPVRGQAGR